MGGNGAELLGWAGAHADGIGLQGLGATLPDGHRHRVRWSPEWLDRQVDQIRQGAGTRFAQIEMDALVQFVQIMDAREAAIEALCAQHEGLVPAEMLTIPYVLIGTVEQVAEKILLARERWGITYFVVRDIDTFAPVIQWFHP